MRILRKRLNEFKYKSDDSPEKTSGEFLTVYIAQIFRIFNFYKIIIEKLLTKSRV